MIFLIIILVFLLINLNYALVYVNEEFIMCISLGLFFSFLFYVGRTKINLLGYTYIKAMYMQYAYLYMINIQSISLFLNMYKELYRIFKINNVSEYIGNALVGIKNIYKLMVFKVRLVAVIFTSYWIVSLYKIGGFVEAALQTVRLVNKFIIGVAYKRSFKRNNKMNNYYVS